MFYLLTPLTRVCIRTGTVKPGAVSVTNLLTYPSIETRIGAAASVDAMMLLWCVFVSTLWPFKGFFSSPCSLNWVGMCVLATIDKSHRKRIELITSSASKVHVRATHSGVPEWR